VARTARKEKASSVDPLEAEVPEEESAEEHERHKRGYLLRTFWQTTRRFRSGQRRVAAWSLTGGLLLVTSCAEAGPAVINVKMSS